MEVRAVSSPKASGVLRQDELLKQIEELRDIEPIQAIINSLQSSPGGSNALTVEQLSTVISTLDSQIQSEVISHHEELLQQLASLKDTEGVLTVVRAGADSLLASVQRVQAELAEPYKQIKTKTRQLEALHDTIDLLRAVIKFLKLVRKLRDQMAPGVQRAELAKAGQLFHEICSLRVETSLDGVEVVEAEVAWVNEAGQQVRQEAFKNLDSGMEALNQAEVGSTLQVFFNMGELRGAVDQQVVKYRTAAVRAIASGLDMKAISAAGAAGGVPMPGSAGPGSASRIGTPPLGSSARARDALWQRLCSCLDDMHRITVAAWHLQRVLAKKRDPLSHVVFLEHILQEGDLLPTEKVWDAVVRSFSNQMRSAFASSSFAKETFVGGFPRLVAQLEGLVDRIIRDTDVRAIASAAATGATAAHPGSAAGAGVGVGSQVRGASSVNVALGVTAAAAWGKGATPPAIGADHRAQLMATLDHFQSAYLVQSLSRMNEAVNAVLPPGTVRGFIPGGADVAARLVGRIQEEMDAVGDNRRLLQLVLKNAGKALQMLAERCEYQVATGPDARQVSSGATSSQLRNLSLCSLLSDVHWRMAEMMSELPPLMDEAVGAGIGAVHGVAMDAVAPLFKAMGDRIEACLLQMHDDDFSSDSPSSSLSPDHETAGDNCSPYMELTVRALTHFHSEFLSKLPSPLHASSPSSSSSLSHHHFTSSTFLPGTSAAASAPLSPGSGLPPMSAGDPIVVALTQRLASRTLRFFVRHVALVRPLSEAGKLRLARDMGELEFAVGQQLMPMHALGDAYRALRALRPLLFTETEAIPTSTFLQDLPSSVVLHHLFSRGPNELQSPFRLIQQTPARYSLWLDQHSEAEAWRNIKASLDAYARAVQARGGKEFTPVYPLMLSLGQTLVEGKKDDKGRVATFQL